MSSNEFVDALRDRQMLSGTVLRLGIVKDQDVSLCRLRVAFSELDQMLSYWLPVVVPKTQDDKAYWLPDIGEQVVCLMDARDEAGVVVGAIYSQSDVAPVQSADKFHLGFKDGTAIEYDRAAHALALNFQDNAAIKYDGSAHTLTLSFEDQAFIKYDAAGHSLTIGFNDGTAIKYDATAHIFSLIGGAGASVEVSASAGIMLQSGTSYVSIVPAGVTVNPPLS